MPRNFHVPRPPVDAKNRPLVDPFVFATGPWALRSDPGSRSHFHMLGLRPSEERMLSELVATRSAQNRGKVSTPNHVLREALALYWHLHNAPLIAEAAEARAAVPTDTSSPGMDVIAPDSWWVKMAALREGFVSRGIVSLADYLSLAAAAVSRYLAAHPGDLAAAKWAKPLPPDRAACVTRRLGVVLDPALAKHLAATIDPDLGRVLPRLEQVFRNRKLKLTEGLAEAG